MMTDKTLTKTELRKFGLMFAAMTLLLFVQILPRLWHIKVNNNAITVGVVIAVLALVLPKTLILLYKPWLKLAKILGFINTKIILCFLYYGVLLPISLLLRLFRYDALAKKQNPNADSYKSKYKSSDDMEAPF